MILCHSLSTALPLHCLLTLFFFFLRPFPKLNHLISFLRFSLSFLLSSSTAIPSYVHLSSSCAPTFYLSSFFFLFPPPHSGPEQSRIQIQELGHLLICSIICSHPFFICWLCTVCFACALCCSLTPKLVGQ